MESNTPTNNANNVSWKFAEWLFTQLLLLIKLSSVANEIEILLASNWSDTDIIQIVHDGGWDWSEGLITGRPGSYNTVKQHFQKRHHNQLNFPVPKRSTQLNIRLLEKDLLQFLNEPRPQKSLQHPLQFDHLCLNHPVIQIFDAKQYLSSRGFVFRYHDIKQVYLKIRKTHKRFFSFDITNPVRGASSSDALAASQLTPSIPQHISSNNSLNTPFTNDSERNDEFWIQNLDLESPEFFGLTSSPSGFHSFSSQFDDFPPSTPTTISYQNFLEPQSHNTSNHTALEIPGTASGTSLLDHLPICTGMSDRSYPALFSTTPDFQQASENQSVYDYEHHPEHNYHRQNR